MLMDISCSQHAATHLLPCIKLQAGKLKRTCHLSHLIDATELVYQHVQGVAGQVHAADGIRHLLPASTQLHQLRLSSKLQQLM